MCETRAEKETGVSVLKWKDQYTKDVFVVWNPAAVKEVIQANPDFDLGDVDPYNQHTFGTLITALSENTASPDESVIEGVLLGIPRFAAETHVAYHYALADLCDDLSFQAERQGRFLFFDPLAAKLHPVGQLTYNKGGVKDRLLAFADEIGYALTPELRNYIESLRGANVPGFRYGTTGNSTIQEEESQTKAWESSGMNGKLHAFLVRHGV